MGNKVAFTSQDHLITQQAAAEKQFLAAFEKKQPTFDEPQVVFNPYLINPLCALVLFKTKDKVAPTLTVHGKRYERENITHTFPAATDHFLPVLGLYEDFDNKVTIALPDGTSKTLTITTDKLPEDVCRCINIQATLDYLGDDIMFLTPAGKNLPTAYDYKGDIRWMLTENTMFDIKRMKNGNIVTGSSRFCHMPYNSTGMIEINLLGKIYKEYRMPGNYHHDHFEMEDGNILACTQDFGRDTVEDMLVLIDRNTGDILKTWDYQKSLPQDVGGSGSQDDHDWFHNNAVWYDKKTHSLTLSGRHQDAVINIDYDSGKLNWIIGDPDNWPQDMVDQYFFKPVGDVRNFDWQYEQHACVVVPDGDIMCFDNGHWRAKRKENYVPAKDNFSRGVRYRIDTQKMEIEQVWQFGKERGEDFFSTYICNVEYYSEGHYLVHSGGIGRFKGETLNKPPAQVRGEDEKDLVLNSVTVELKDDVIMYEMHLPANYYRAEKLSPYCKEDVLSFGKGELLGDLGVTEAFLTIPEAEDGGEVPDQYNVKIGLEEDRIILKATFEKGQMVMLLLEGADTIGYFVPTTKRPFLAMCVGTFQEADERAVEFPVSRKGLAGSYSLKLIIDDKKHDTGVKLVL